MRRQPGVWILLAFALAVLPGSVAAQDPEHSPVPSFVGAGVTYISDNSFRRDRLLATGLDETTGFPWLIEGGIRLHRRVGVGVEVTGFGGITGLSSHPSSRVSEEESEVLVLPVVRIRAHGNRRFAVDLVGGAGWLMQRAERVTFDCYGKPCEAGPPRTTRDWTPSFGAGADLPITLLPHFSVSGSLRMLAARRSPERRAREFFGSKSPTFHLSAGVSARLIW